MIFAYKMVYIYINMGSTMYVSCCYLTPEPSVGVVVIWVRVLDRSCDDGWQSHSITSTPDPQHSSSSVIYIFVICIVLTLSVIDIYSRSTIRSSSSLHDIS